MLIERIDITADPDETDEWPFTVPAVRQVADAGLALKSPLTFLVGENGSGKSTLVEAIAARGVPTSRLGRDVRPGNVPRYDMTARRQTARGLWAAMSTIEELANRLSLLAGATVGADHSIRSSRTPPSPTA